MELISPSEVDALGEYVEAGMQTPVSILSLTSIPVEDGDDQRVWATTANTMGWIFEPPDYPRGGQIGGVVGSAQEFRMYINRDIAVALGDRVGADGAIYEVLNSNDANTYRPMTRLSLRRAE